jgi:copper chaperone CopZ
MDPADPHNLHDTADHAVLETIDIATEGDECVRRLRGPLLKIDGVKEVKADPKTERVWVTFDARKTHAPAIHDAILKSGYRPAPFAD